MTTKHDRIKYKQEYAAWCNMKYRCYNEKHHAYSCYGGRGISVQPDWQVSFHSFLLDVGPINHNGQRWSLERIDVDGNYEKGNVKWESFASQARNRRKQSRNTSGKTGVCGVTKGKYSYYVAFWSEINGVKKEKTFSVMRLGEQGAFEAATTYRNEMIENLNTEGANYSEKHGE